MSCILIHQYTDYFSLFSCLSANYHFNLRNLTPISAIFFLNCSVPVYICNNIKNINLYPHGNNFIHQDTVLTCSTFTFSLTHFWLLKSVPSPAYHSVKLFHTFVTQLNLIIGLDFFLVFSDLLNDLIFRKYAYVKVHYLCCIQSFVF